MIQIYVTLVKLGIKTIDQVPPKIRAEVQAALNA